MVDSGNGTKYVGLKFLNILDALESMLAITLRNVTNKIGMKKLNIGYHTKELEEKTFNYVWENYSLKNIRINTINIFCAKYSYHRK